MNIRELEKQATPGPWTVVNSTQVFLNAEGPRVHVADCIGQTQRGLHAGLMHAANARLLVHFRNNFMRALEALKKAQSILDSEFPSTDERHPKQWGLDRLIAELEEVK